MPHSIFNPADRAALLRRVATVTASSPRHWGRLTPGGMLAHLSESARMALGDLVIAPRRGPLRFPPLRHAIIHWLPFPKGAPTAPELVARTTDDCRPEAETLKALVERLAQRQGAAEWPVHPAFGALSERDWGVLAHRHMDHHLRQFGA